MPERVRDLPFRSGFISPPVPRDQTGDGVPDLQNLCLTPDGSALTPMPGTWRTFPYRLLQAGDAHTGAYRVVSFPSQALLTAGGRGIGVVDEVTGRAVGVAYHPGGVNVDPAITPAPTTLGYLNRQGPHDYPQLLNSRGITQIHTPYDEPRCFDGAAYRKLGIRAPQRPLTLSSAGGSGGFIDNVDQALPTTPLYTSSRGTNVVINPSAGLPTYDSDDQIDTDAADSIPGYNHFRLKAASPGPGDLGWRTYLTPQTLASTVTRMSVWLYYWAKKRLLSDASSPVLYLVFDNTANFTGTVAAGTRLEFPIVVHNRPYAWTKVEAPITIAVNFTYSSFGLRLAKTVPQDHFRKDEDGINYVKWRLDGIRFFNPTAAASAALVQGEPLPTDKYVLMFSWYDSVRFRESNPSPFTPQLEFGANVAFNLDVSGYYPRVPAGVQNTAPDATIDKVRIYIHRLSWGTDNPDNPAQGRPLFRRLIEVDVPTPDGSGRLVVSFTNQHDETEILNSAPPTYENDVPPSVSCVIADGERILYAGMPFYAVGRVKTTGSTDGSGNDTNSGQLANIINRKLAYTNNTTGVLDYYDTSPGAGFTYSPENTPVFGPHLEGRSIRIGTDSATYQIIKALDVNADGTYESLFVGTGELEQGYPTDNTTVKYIIEGYPNRIWWTYKGNLGVNQEAVPLFNYKDLEIPGDELVGLCHIGDYVMACGRRHPTFLLQDVSSLDDLTNAGDPYPRPRTIYGSPGCVSGRTMVQLPNRTAMWLSPEGKLVLATPGEVSHHPVSELFRGWISSYYKINESDLRFSHGFYLPSRNWYVLLPIASSTLGGTNEGGFAAWPDAPAPDPQVAFAAADPGPTTEQYCTPWEDYDGTGGVNYDTHIVELDAPGLAAYPGGIIPVEWSGRAVVAVGHTVFSISTTTPTAVEPWVSADPTDPTDTDPFGYTGLNFNRFVSDSGIYENGVFTPIGGTFYINGFSAATYKNFLHPDALYLTCWMRCSIDIPVGMYRLALYGGNGSTQRLFDSATALVANTWTYVRFESADGLLDGMVYEWELMDLFAMIDLGVVVPVSVTLDIANGRQIAGYATNDIPAEIDWSLFVCAPYGSALDVAPTLATDFTRALVFDLNLNVLLPGYGYNLCSVLGNASPCAGAAQLPNVLIGVTTDGYLTKVMTEDAQGLGTPMSRVYWPISSATTTIITIDAVTLQTFFASAGQNFLKGLPVRVFYTDYTYVDRVVSTNTNTTLTLTVALLTTTGLSHILIAPMLCGIMFQEARYLHPATLVNLLMNNFSNSVAEQRYTLNIYGAEAASDNLDLSAPMVSYSFGENVQQLGRGEIRPPRKASKSITPVIMLNPYGAGALTLGPIRVTECLHPAEIPRSIKVK